MESTGELGKVEDTQVQQGSTPRADWTRRQILNSSHAYLDSLASSEFAAASSLVTVETFTIIVSPTAER